MNLILRLFFSAVLLVFVLTSCENDPCEGLFCDNGVCDAVSGECICSQGYQTNLDGICTVQWTEKMLGSYAVSDSCTGPNPGTTTYNGTIAAIDEANLSITNFSNMGYAVSATHTNSMNFEIDENRNDTIISGTGILVADTLIRINYMINDTTNQRIDTCTAIYTKL